MSSQNQFVRNIVYLVISLAALFLLLTALDFFHINPKDQAQIPASDSSGAAISSYLSEADTFFAQHKTEEARLLYEKAADLGSAEGYFKLAYDYSVSKDKEQYYLTEAAKRGHSEALRYLMDDLFYRADSLRVDPKALYATYLASLNAGATLSYGGESLRECAEAPSFDADAFEEKYRINGDIIPGDYPVWKLAEEASRGGRFGKPDPTLVFQLVCRGGEVPAELEGAVGDAYTNWKSGTVKPFNICDYITSGYGEGYCAAKENDKEENARLDRIEALVKKLGLDQKSRSVVDDAYGALGRFLRGKVLYEEGNGGSGRAAWEIESENSQKNDYLTLIEKVANGYVITASSSLVADDQKLNDTYQSTISALSTLIQEHQNSTSTDFFYPEGLADTVDELVQDQRVWIVYRDKSVALFENANSKVSADVYDAYFTEMRSRDLEYVLQLIQN